MGQHRGSLLEPGGHTSLHHRRHSHTWHHHTPPSSPSLPPSLPSPSLYILLLPGMSGGTRAWLRGFAPVPPFIATWGKILKKRQLFPDQHLHTSVWRESWLAFKWLFDSAYIRKSWLTTAMIKRIVYTTSNMQYQKLEDLSKFCFC
jgi:hypothetical protein